MNILVLGAGGLAGRAICRRLSRRHTVFGTFRRAPARGLSGARWLLMNVADPRQVDAVLQRADPEAVVSCLRGPFPAQLAAHGQIARALRERGTGQMVFLSTANVFDGADSAPHTEQDAPCAESEYGQFKIQCEETLRDLLGERAAILRLPFLWGADGPRLEELMRAAARGEPVPVWAGLRSNHATDLQTAQFAEWVIEQRKSGVFHVGTDVPCEYDGFVSRLLERQGFAGARLAPQELPHARCLAVVCGRKDVPQALHRTTEQLLRELDGPEKR